jgi:excinuclease ABC subunit A
VVVIEHNLDVIKVSDRLIDLGPEGGDEGGRVIAIGTPEEVASEPASYTGQFLAGVLEVKAKRARKPAARTTRSANGAGGAKPANGSGAKAAGGRGDAKAVNGSGGAKPASGRGGAKAANGTKPASGRGGAKAATGSKGGPSAAGGSGNGSGTRRRASAGKR